MACPEHLGSCFASAAWFFVSPPAPSESYRSSPLASDSTLPVGEQYKSGKEGGHTLSKGNRSWRSKLGKQPSTHAFQLGWGWLSLYRGSRTDRRAKPEHCSGHCWQPLDQRQTFLFVSDASLGESQGRASRCLQGTPRSLRHSTAQRAPPLTPGTPRQKPAAGWFLDPIQQPLNTRFLSLGLSSVLSSPLTTRLGETHTTR